MRRAKEITAADNADRFRGMRSDYNAAQISPYRRRPTGISPLGSGADYHVRSEVQFWRMLELARDLMRNHCLLGQGIRRLADNVLQDGFKYDPQTGNPEADEILAGRWRRWSEDPDRCDASGRFCFEEMVRLVLTQTIVDGDILGLLTRGGQVELVEAHRLRSPSRAVRDRADGTALIHGVQIDGNRRPISYWLTRQDLDPTVGGLKVSQIKKYPARDGQGRQQVLHVYAPDRVSQTRGVTALQPAVDTASQGDDLFFAQLVKAQVASVFAVMRELPLEFGGPPAGKLGPQMTESTSADGFAQVLEGLSPGAILQGRPGEKLQGFSPNVPNAEFFQHATLLLTIVAVNIGMPVAMFLLDPSQTNFSGWRGAIDQARLGFKKMQRWLLGRFHRPVVAWQIRRWIGEDARLAALAEDPETDLFAHRWNPPSWPYIEPLKDASSDLLRCRNAQISRRRWAAERGFDWDDLTTEIVEDHATLISKAFERAQELNQKHEGLEVTWRELACLPTPDGVQVSVPVTAGDQPRPPARKQEDADDGDH